MPQVIDPLQYIVGAGDVYYRAVGNTGPWTGVGATSDDIIFRVNQTINNPSESFNGLLEKVMLLDYVSKTGAEAEFTMHEIAGTKLAIAIPNVTGTTLATTAAGTPLSTTLSAATIEGATTINVVSATNAAVGDYIKIDVGGLIEYRVITLIASLAISFRDPLRIAHASGVAVSEVVGDGKTEYTPSNTRRMPATAYNDFAIVAQSPADYYELYLYNAISQTESAEITLTDDATQAAGIKVTLGTRRSGAALTTPSWKLRVPAS